MRDLNFLVARVSQTHTHTTNANITMARAIRGLELVQVPQSLQTGSFFPLIPMLYSSGRTAWESIHNAVSKQAVHIRQGDCPRFNPRHPR